MASFAEALIEGALGAAQGGAATAIDRARAAREEAFTREGWGRQEARDKESRQFQAEQKQLDREAADERSRLDRESRERAAATKASGGEGGGKMQIKELADGRVIASQGGSSFMLNESNQWVPIGVGADSGQTVDTVTVDPEETEEGWFDSIISGSKSLANKLFGEDEAQSPTMAGEASKAPVANYEATKAQLKQTLENDGYGAFDSALRQSNLNPIQQIQLMASIGLDKIPSMPDTSVNYEQASQSPQAVQAILQGTGISVSDYQKVKQQHPDKSDDVIIRSIQEYYNQQ